MVPGLIWPFRLALVRGRVPVACDAFVEHRRWNQPGDGLIWGFGPSGGPWTLLGSPLGKPTRKPAQTDTLCLLSWGPDPRRRQVLQRRSVTRRRSQNHRSAVWTLHWFGFGFCRFFGVSAAVVAVGCNDPIGNTPVTSRTRHRRRWAAAPLTSRCVGGGVCLQNTLTHRGEPGGPEWARRVEDCGCAPTKETGGSGVQRSTEQPRRGLAADADYTLDSSGLAWGRFIDHYFHYKMISPQIEAVQRGCLKIDGLKNSLI